LETRAGLPTIDGLFDGGGAVGHGQTLDLTVTGRGGVPATGVGAVVLNVTATEPTASGFVTVYPTGTQRPNASNLNFVAGQTTPNLVIAKVGDGGKVSLFNFAGSTHLIADVVGWYPSSASVSPVVGDYNVIYATPGAVTVHASAAGFTVSVKAPFQVEGATCALPVGSVVATFSGAGPNFSGGHFAFNPTTCVGTGAAGGIAVFANTDGTITLGTFFGPHLLTPV
jgi:hypothetical protein